MTYGIHVPQNGGTFNLLNLLSRTCRSTRGRSYSLVTCHQSHDPQKGHLLAVNDSLLSDTATIQNKTTREPAVLGMFS